jgi:hypothetical protein
VYDLWENYVIHRLKIFINTGRIKLLLEKLKEIEDHRRPEGREYYLHDVLFISILALLSGSKGYTDISRFMDVHFEKLKKILKLKWRRVPHFSAVRKIIVGIDPSEIERVFRCIAQDQKEKNSEGHGQKLHHICFDGKSLNGSFSHVQDKRAFNIFQAFAKYSQIIIGHMCLEDKDSEINAFG